MSLLPNTSSDYLKGIQDCEIEITYLKTLTGALKAIIKDQQEEINRLKEGNFTKEEFQNLCHNKSVQEGFNRFRQGCLEYQKKLFGAFPCFCGEWWPMNETCPDCGGSRETIKTAEEEYYKVGETMNPEG
jgi:hypothetical protein